MALSAQVQEPSEIRARRTVHDHANGGPHHATGVNWRSAAQSHNDEARHPCGKDSVYLVSFAIVARSSGKRRFATGGAAGSP